jgi:hypothetical protein
MYIGKKIWNDFFKARQRPGSEDELKAYLFDQQEMSSLYDEMNQSFNLQREKP